jgi:hypothetical protein
VCHDPQRVINLNEDKGTETPTARQRRRISFFELVIFVNYQFKQHP